MVITLYKDDVISKHSFIGGILANYPEPIRPAIATRFKTNRKGDIVILKSFSITTNFIFRIA